MKKLWPIVGTVLLASAAAYGCSLSSIVFQPAEPNFTVWVTHAGKKISGIEVVVVSHGLDTTTVFKGVTDNKGGVEISNLPDGHYDLQVSHAGVDAGTQWIEVGSKPAKRKKSFNFEWAASSYRASRVAGVLSGLVSGDTGNKIMDIVHPKTIVHPGIALVLRNAFSDDEYRTLSDSSGSFFFEAIPAGTYILTIAGGTRSLSGIADESVLVIDVIPSAKMDYFPLQLGDVGCYRIGYEMKPGIG